jgi:hypothetical protein
MWNRNYLISGKKDTTGHLFLSPKKWLNHGLYTILVGIVQYNPMIVYDRAEAIQFSILDIGTPESIRGQKGREGILQPFIKWDLISNPN